MIKIEHIIVALVAVLAVAGIGYVAYDQGLLKGVMGEKSINVTPTPLTVMDDETIISQPVSALTALSTVEGSSKFKNWKAGKADAFVTGISSESCNGGLSNIWTITYVSGSEQAVVLYDSGRILNIIKSPIQGEVSQMPKLISGSVMDSNKASDIASANLTARGKVATGLASFELAPGAQNTSNWDVIYRITDGFYMIRLDSASGNVLESTQYNMG